MAMSYRKKCLPQLVLLRNIVMLNHNDAINKQFLIIEHLSRICAVARFSSRDQPTYDAENEYYKKPYCDFIKINHEDTARQSKRKT